MPKNIIFSPQTIIRNEPLYTSWSEEKKTRFEHKFKQILHISFTLILYIDQKFKPFNCRFYSATFSTWTNDETLNQRFILLFSRRFSVRCQTFSVNNYKYKKKLNKISETCLN